MSYYQYDFVTVASDNGAYILADRNGGSYYLPEQVRDALGDKQLAMGEIVRLSAENPLEMTELAGTNSIICRGTVYISLHGSLLETGNTAELLVCHTAYGSVLLTDMQSGTDYVIFTSYVTEGYRTPNADWSAVTEGNLVKFLLFGDFPVMPAPRKRPHFRIRRKNKKTPAVRSFLNGTYGAISGASMNSSPSSGMTS
ncbi:MAG: hypothetical protein IJ644_06770 [Oscillospiraceae bacterium]|nr:hypothetical protein [Oscillospiraceae bacterium]